MNTNEKKYNVFLESVCKQFNCTEMLPVLKEGFKAFCEANMRTAPAFEGIGIYNTTHLTADEMLLLQEMRQYYKDLCQDGYISDCAGNPLSSRDNLAMLDTLIEFYNSAEDLPEGFLALYRKLGGKKNIR